MLTAGLAGAQDHYVLESKYPAHGLQAALRVIADPEDTLSRERLLPDSGLVFMRGPELPRFFESMAERRNINLHTHCSTDDPQAFYDADKLEKILTNLLANAFKYTPDGGTVTAVIDLEPGLLRLEVSDTGASLLRLDKVGSRKAAIRLFATLREVGKIMSSHNRLAFKSVQP